MLPKNMMDVTKQIETILITTRTLNDDRRDEGLMGTTHRRTKCELAICRTQILDTNEIQRVV